MGIYGGKMMNINRKKIQIKDKTIDYTHIKVDSKIICFMFSGAGYKYDSPLFYYSTRVMLQNNIDIVRVHYSYDEKTMKKTMKN